MCRLNVISQIELTFASMKGVARRVIVNAFQTLEGVEEKHGWGINKAYGEFTDEDGNGVEQGAAA